MITDKETNKVFLSEVLKTDQRFTNTCSEITEILQAFQVNFEFLPKTRDIWARDYMPVQVSDHTFVEFRYDPDYLQGEENRIYKTYPDIVCDALGLKTLKSDIVLDGGNVIKAKNCVILTDKVLVENESIYTPEEITRKLKQLFEVAKVVLIPWDKKNDFYGHADGMIRFIDENKVLLQDYFETYPQKFKEQLYHVLKENNLEWETLKFNVPRQDLNRNWAYLNFLQTKDIIVMPKLGIAEDEQAFEQMKSIFPDYAERCRIFQVDMSHVVEEGGALNCITWTIKV
ncbi:MAG: agmatine deiminase family protein [Prolixibacteraceae bacterium]